jgi:peptide subunit release factor 1 (eRF1)
LNCSHRKKSITSILDWVEQQCTFGLTLEIISGYSNEAAIFCDTYDGIGGIFGDE